MNYMRVILIWVAISITLGFILKYAYKIEENGFFALLLGMGLIVGFVRAFLIYFASSSKSEIYTQARKMFNGKINLNGETELLINDRKIILDYKLEKTGNRVFEYVIAKIDLTNTPNDIMTKFNEKFDIIELNNRTYAVIYCSWGFKGADFKKRIEKKLIEIENALNEKNVSQQLI